MRTDKDYAIEHAGYLATAATDYLDAINAEYVAQIDHEEQETDETEKALNEAIEAVGEANRTLRNRIYEFEKRRDRVLSAVSKAAHYQEGRDLLPDGVGVLDHQTVSAQSPMKGPK